MTFDVLTTNAIGLQHLLDQNKITSVQIVQAYFVQIDRHESSLNALISTAPRDDVLANARTLDAERQTSRIRSPFHGVPIILKDSFVTASHLGMSTTAGSHAFIGSLASKNGAITQRLLDAGLIVLGKGNMTEFAGMKMTMMMSGWSAHSGKTLSPYVGKMEENEKLLGHSAPGGSSTGSAVSVAAGFAPLAMGTETIGSIVTPSTRAALYALKPTVGLQDTEGLYCMTEFFDSPGPMAKSASDVRILTEILLERKFDLPAESNIWEGIEVGFLDPTAWKMAEDFCTQFEGTAEQMSTKPWLFIEVSDQSKGYINSEGNTLNCIVADIVKYNNENRETALPIPFTEQNDLEASMTSLETKQDIDRLKHDLRSTARSILDEAFAEQQINLIIAPGDSPLCIHAAAAGYPIATVPIGQLRYNRRPFGLCVVAKAHDEGILLQFMSAYEKVAKPRPVLNL